MVMHCSTSEHSYCGNIIMDNLVPVYDIMIIDSDNKVKQIRLDAGTSTVLSVISGEWFENIINRRWP